MWILPKQLHTLASALDTEALTWDSEQLCQIYEQSLTVNGKPSRSRSFSAALKKDNWMSALSTRTLKPSLGNSFVTKYLSCQGATHANHSAQQESVLEQKIQGTFGPTSQMELLQCDQMSVSLKTLRDISRWGCPTSSKTWDAWVTERRGAYSLRAKLAHLTRESGFSLWPTVTASEARQGFQDRSRGMKGQQESLTTIVVKERNWATPEALNSTGYQISNGQKALRLSSQVTSGLLAPEKPNTNGSRQELWRTPSSSDGEGGIMEMRPGTAGKYKLRDHVHAKWPTPDCSDRRGPGSSQQGLSNVVKNWATPNTLDHMELRSPEALLRQATTTREGRTAPANLREQVDPASVEIYETRTAPPKQKITHKLNPRWVETLMGLPIGWVMPSCKDPITPIAEPTVSMGGGQLDDSRSTEQHRIPSEQRQEDPAARESGTPDLYTSCDNRTDELRLLGNGVVLATAELAFRTLLKELTK